MAEVKFVSYAEMLRLAHEQATPHSGLLRSVRFWESLSADVREQLDSIGALFERKVVYAGGSIGNCGTAVVTNITAGYVLKTQVCNKASLKASSPLPTCLTSQFGYLQEGAETALNNYSMYLRSGTEKRYDLVREFGKKILNAHFSAIISDSVNRHSGHRGGGQRTPGLYYTADFMDLVEESKIGYLVKSPVSINTAHNRVGDISLIRHWVYYPEGSVVMKADKYLGSGNKIANSPDCFLKEGYNTYVDKFVADKHYTREELVSAFRDFRKGTLLEGKKDLLDKKA